MNTFDLIISLFEVIISLLFFSKYLTMKSLYNKKAFLLYSIIGFFLIICSQLFFSNQILMPYLILLINLIFVFKFTKNLLIEKLFICFFTFVLTLIMDGLVMLIFSIILFDNISVDKLLVSNLIYPTKIFIELVLMVTLYTILSIRKKYQAAISENQILTMFIFTVFIIIIYLPFKELIYTNSFSNDIYVIGFTALSIFSIVMITTFFNLLSINKKISDDEISLLLKNNKLQSIKQVYQLNDNIISLKHDMRHVLSYINSCIDDGKIIEAKKCIDGYNESITSVEMISKVTKKSKIKNI